MNNGAAVIEGPYRYLLRRVLPGNGNGVCLFVMLNPSTADAEVDDPTIRRCKRFATDWRYAELQVVNLFAYRAANPKTLLHATDPEGPHNSKYIAEAVKNADLVIAAWGVRPQPLILQNGSVGSLMTSSLRMFCLGRNKDGSPKHPLYVAANTKPIAWNPASAQEGSTSE